MSIIATSSFTADASGSADAVVVPTVAKGATRLHITPPSGHAWSLAAPNVDSTVHNYQLDEQADLPCVAVIGKAVAYVALDTGTGTFQTIWYTP